MDHWYIWVIEPADPGFVQMLVNSAQLKRVAAHENIGGLGSTWPTWWPRTTIEALPEHYYREDINVNWHVWVDSTNDRIYVQWFDT